MTIQAIETKYKGYRFRSRLEARWAVAFEEMGWDWQYEPEGYVVNGRPYLPDFLVGGPLDAFIEIKPGYPPRLHVPKIYMAGKMPQGNWRDWRPGAIPSVDVEDPYPPRRRIEWGGFYYVYVGPFGDDDTRDHGYKHGVEECGQHGENILHRSLTGIDLADAVIAIIDTPDCYGTLVEIGYAKAQQKSVYVAFCDGSCLYPGSEYLHSDLQFEMWFASEAASFSQVFADRDTALKWALTQAGAEDKTPEEVRLIGGLIEATGRRGCVSYGTPGEHREWGNVTIPLSDKAIERARSARFEHGERG